MAQNHEDAAAELHETFNERTHHQRNTDLAGGYLSQNHNDVASIDEKKDFDTENGLTADGEEPSEHERRSLRRVGENLPASAFLIAIVELTERFAYYGAQGLFQNYVAHAKDGADGAKGVGLNGQAATGLNLAFQFFSYATPILGAIISDQYLGKYKTIIVFAGVYWVGLLILWITALPFARDQAGLAGYCVAIVVIGFGTGGIKSNIAPLIADQYQRRRMAIKTEANGERVIIDPAITYQRIYMVFYWCINVGALSLMATPFMEKYCGFWTAFLMCFCMFNIGVIVLIIRRKSYIVRPPQGSVITDAFKAIGIMIGNRNYDAAKPSWRAANGKTKAVPWNDHFVDEIKRALRACKVFVFYPIFWVCYGQFSTNFVTQAEQMEGHGMPNDFMQNFDPISILIFTPVLDRLVYPVLRKAGIELRPIARISIGFFFAALCLAYAAIVQHLVYSAGPCFEWARDEERCAAAVVDGKIVSNHVHIAIQTPAYLFIGIAEIFLSVTGLEYAYTKAPPSMKSFVQSLYLFTNAFGAAINLALVSVAKNPKFVWMYTGVGITAFITSIGFYAMFRHYDAQEEEMYDLDRDEPVLTKDGKPVNISDSEDARSAENGVMADNTTNSETVQATEPVEETQTAAVPENTVHSEKPAAL